MDKTENFAAKIICKPLAGSRAGVMRASYYGPVDAPTLVRLRDEALELLEGASALVVRTDTALMAMHEVPLIKAPGVWVPPAALIVTPDQRDLWVEYSRQLAGVGITRAVFLPEQMDCAYRWAERQAELRAW